MNKKLAVALMAIVLTALWVAPSVATAHPPWAERAFFGNLP